MSQRGLKEECSVPESRSLSCLRQLCVVRSSVTRLEESSLSLFHVGIFLMAALPHSVRISGSSQEMHREKYKHSNPPKNLKVMLMVIAELREFTECPRIAHVISEQSKRYILCMW